MGIILGVVGAALLMGVLALLTGIWNRAGGGGTYLQDAANRALFGDESPESFDDETLDERTPPITGNPVPDRPAGPSSATDDSPSRAAPPGLASTPKEAGGQARKEAGFPTLLVISFRNLVRLPVLDRRGAALLVSFVVLGWAASGAYVVQPDEISVVQRFGRWVGTESPGLHYHLPYPIETVTLPKVTQVHQLEIGDVDESTGNMTGTLMLTGDENVVGAEFAVFWKIKDVRQFLFENSDQDDLVRNAAETVLHDVIARYPIQDELSDKRQEIADRSRQNLQGLLDSYKAGIEILQVQLQGVDPPPEVVDAFNDVQRALADRERARNDAEAYSNDILPRARGQAAHIVQDADAYKTQVIDAAQGDISGFLAAYKVYKQSPEVFSWRLYLNSMDAVLAHAGKVVILPSAKSAAPMLPYFSLGDQKPAQPAGGTP